MSNGENSWFAGAIHNQQMETSKGLVEFADVGRGPAILYFHGTGAGNDAAVIMERLLLEDGFRLIVPNRPGYFGTSLACGRSPNDCADLAAELLEQLNIERAVVIGTSGGGLPACSFAAQHPGRATALILQCALCHPFTSSRWMPRQLRWLYPLFRYHRLCLPILRIGFRWEMHKLRRDPNGVVSYMSGERQAELYDDEATNALVPLLVESELRCARLPAGIENDWANAVDEDWLRPDSVRCPTLILHDRADPLVPFAHVEWAMNCIRDAEFCDLHAGGHLIWVGKHGSKMRDVRAAFIRRQIDGAGQ